MNICIICHDAYMSGANKSLYDWVKHDKNDKFIIVLPHANSNQDFVKLSNVEVFSGNYFCLHNELSRKPLPYVLKRCVKTIYMGMAYRIVINRLKNFIKNQNIDAIISNSFSVYYGAVVAKELNIKHFWHIREFMDLDHQISHKNPTLINELAEYSNAIFISDVIAEYYKTRYRFNNSIVIYNQIQIAELFNKDKEVFSNDKIRILMSGVLQENKGQKEAIEAVVNLLSVGYNIQFDIWGKGPQLGVLEAIIKKSGYTDAIALKGYSNNLDDFRHNYDAVLVCSSNEALGRVTIESMGSGCITIGADAGCTSKLIQDGYNGFLYELHNVKDLSEKIVYIFNHKEVVCDLRKRARLYVEKNFANPIHEKIVDYIKQCI